MTLARALAAVAACLVWAAPAEGRGLRLGFTDRLAYQRDATDRAAALAHTREAGGSIIRITLGWRGISRTGARPPAGRAADPSWSGYDWDEADTTVRDVAAAGLTPFLTFTGAPDWAEGPGRAGNAPAGTWRPSPSGYADFAFAAARRYSGSYPDPERPGRRLPRVRLWEAWNEPNVTRYLSPQFVLRGGRYVPESPAHYRRLLNAFYAGVKQVDPGNVVVSGGTAPYHDPNPSGGRMAPALFVRQLLCLRNRRRLRPFRCGDSPARFDVLSHHPYSVGSPTRRALNRDDVAVPDLRKLRRPLNAAVRRGTVSPRRRKPIWITEIAWDSRPPDPRGVSQGRHARWLEGSFYVLWRQGVSLVTWFNLRDEPPGEGFRVTSQSGIYNRGAGVAADRRKPAFTAFRFPFTAYRVRGRARIWGLAPKAGVVVVQVRRRGAWRRLVRRTAGGDRVFSARRRLRRGTLLRARQGGDVSLTWRVR